MSKTTLALIAAASAATGASLTAIIYSSSKPKPQPVPTIPTPTISTPTTTRSSLPTPAPTPYQTTPFAQASPVNPAGLLQYGFPGPPSDVSSTPSHLSSFNRQTRNCHWAAEHITPYSLSLSNGSRRHSFFHEDLALPAPFRAKLTDYARSGYDRGHQVPAADAKWSQEAMDSTFLLSNMCPQVGEGFNRDYWAHFEEFCRELVYSGKYPSVRIVTGPLYLPKRDAQDGKWRVSYEVIGNPPNVAVPTHFYKVIYGEDTPDSPIARVALGAFVLPNAPIPNSKSLSDFEVPLEAVERASGLAFADKLPIERRKKLCEEVRCEILIREFDKAKQQASVGAGNTKQGAVIGPAPVRSGPPPDRSGPPPDRKGFWG